MRARPPPPPEPPEPPGSQTCILSVDESQAAFHIPQPTDTALVQNFHPYILPKGQLNSEQDNKPNIPKATSSNTASTSEQRFFFSVETQTHPEKEVHSSQTSSDQTLQQCDLLEESRIFRNRYIRDFVRKKGLRTRNILLSHSCSDDDVCKKFCKLMEKQKKL